MATNNPLDISDPQDTDSAGNEKMTLNTRLAGEDLANDVQKVENRFSSAQVSSATTSTVKSGAGLLHRVNVVGGTIGPFTIWDNTAGSGTPIASFGSAPIGSYEFNSTFNTGLTIVTTAATNVVLVYR